MTENNKKEEEVSEEPPLELPESINTTVPEIEEKEEEDDDELVFDNNDEVYDDDGELSEHTNNVEIEGGGNAAIVGSKIIIGGGNEDDYSTYPCPNCLSAIDASKYGKIICDNCKFKIFRRNPKLNITRFETIEDKSLETLFLNTVARINNNLIRRKYSLSFKYCLEAEQLAPREPITWEYFTIVEFYHEMGKPKTERKEIHEILRLVRDNVKICEANNVDNDTLESIKGEIGIYLFNLAKSKIGSFYSKSKKQRGYWSKRGRHLTISYLKLFEDCYRLTKDTFYLKGYVDELSKPYKWIIKSRSGDLINLSSCGKRFNAVYLFEKMVIRIQKIEPEYIPPDIEIERLSFSIEPVKEEEEEGQEKNNGISNISIE